MKIVFLSFALAIFITPLAFSQETFTLTTYYPAPFGVYTELRSRRMAIGDNYYQQSAHPWATASPTPAGEIAQDADLVVEGKVGIGITNPVAKLTVLQETDSIPASSSTRVAAFTLKEQNGDESVNLEIYGYPASTDAYLDNTVMLYAPESGEADNLQIVAADDAGTIRFHTAGWQTDATERMRIAANGNVGIGTTSPEEKLHVAGKVKIGAYTLPHTDGVDGQVLTTNGAGVVTWQSSATGQFGGMFSKGASAGLDCNVKYKDQQCRYKNPYTGDCSCPSGYTRQTLNVWPTPAYCHWVYYCYK